MSKLHRTVSLLDERNKLSCPLCGLYNMRMGSPEVDTEDAGVDVIRIPLMCQHPHRWTLAIVCIDNEVTLEWEGPRLVHPDLWPYPVEAIDE